MRGLALALALLALLGLNEAFLRAPLAAVKVVAPASTTAMMSCRRNNKMEKRKRNRDYARKFQSKTGGSRRKVVVEEKRAVVAASEEKFQAQVFKMTTDEDMPAYSGFDFTA